MNGGRFLLAWGILAVLAPGLPWLAEELTLTAEDGWKLAATLELPAGEAPVPAVVLIHQGGSDRSEWAPFCRQLVEAGFACLTYDIRGYGDSGRVMDIRALFVNPNLAPKDLEAALAHLREHPRVEGDRLAVVGSGIGADLACVGVIGMDVRTAVAISAQEMGVHRLSGERLADLRSVFYIASEGDENGWRASWAKQLYERTAEPRKLVIVRGSTARGASLFEDAPELPKEILAWLEERLAP